MFRGDYFLNVDLTLIGRWRNSLHLFSLQSKERHTNSKGYKHEFVAELGVEDEGTDGVLKRGQGRILQWTVDDLEGFVS